MTASYSFNRLAKRKPHLASQLATYFKNQSELFRDREPQNRITFSHILNWSKGYVEEFLLARYDRANEVASREVAEARKLEITFIGPRTHHLMVGCMDGRNMPAVMLSHVPHVGGVMRTQAGELFGFLESCENKSVIIDDNSYTAHLLKKLLFSKAGDTVYYSLDSHMGCAARGEIHSAGGGMANDGGLRADIRRKLLIACGIRNLSRQLRHQGYKTASIYPQFFSYDPHDGTLTMGLELFTETVGKAGYTPEVLKKLGAEKKIITIWQFLHDQKINTVLTNMVTPADFRRAYPQALLKNWRTITKIYDNGRGLVYRAIYKELQTVYANAGWKICNVENPEEQQISTHALEHKAKVILKNLVTRFSIAKDSHEWPFDTHGEQGIVITEGGYAPFPSIDVFSVYSKEDSRPFLDHTYLALQLVRAFRRKGSIRDPFSYLSGDEFVRAPVIIINKAVLREISEDGWMKLAKIDLSPALTNLDWDNPQTLNWTQEEFEHLLDLSIFKEPLLPSDTVQFINGVYEVFDRVRVMMRDYRFRPMLLHAQAIVINALVDRDRRTRVFVPIII